MRNKKEFYIYRISHWNEFKKFIQETSNRIAIKRCITRAFKVTFELIRKEPSNRMRAYYFEVIIPMVKDCLIRLGNNVDEQDVHMFLKDKTKFYTKYVVHIKTKGKQEINEFRTKYKSISFKGEIKETLEYFERIKQWCAENLDLIIPDPEKK